MDGTSGSGSIIRPRDSTTQSQQTNKTDKASGKKKSYASDQTKQPNHREITDLTKNLFNKSGYTDLHSEKSFKENSAIIIGKLKNQYDKGVEKLDKKVKAFDADMEKLGSVIKKMSQRIFFPSSAALDKIPEMSRKVAEKSISENLTKNVINLELKLDSINKKIDEFEESKKALFNNLREEVLKKASNDIDMNSYTKKSNEINEEIKNLNAEKNDIQGEIILLNSELDKLKKK